MHDSIVSQCLAEALQGIGVHKTWMWHIPKVGPKVTESDRKWQKVTESDNKTFTPFKKESTILKKKSTLFKNTLFSRHIYWGEELVSIHTLEFW